MTRTALNPSSVGIPPKRDEPQRPIAKYENGKLWIDDQGIYRKRDEMQVKVLLWSLSHYPNSHTQRINEINTALSQYEREKHDYD